MTIDATKEAITTWFTSVLPSLFPFFVISKCIYYNGGIKFFAKILKPFTSILGLNDNIAFPFAMSMMCGYQTGSRTVLSMNLSDANYYFNVCYCASPLFIIGTVGTSILNSTKLGYELYIIHLCTFVIFSVLYKPKHQYENFAISETYGNFSTAISESISAILSICGYMIFYRIIIEIITLKLPSFLGAFITGVVEFTSGIKYVSYIYSDPLPTISFFLSFGGICVISQCLSIIKNVKKSEFIKNRLICGTIAFILCQTYKKTALYVPVIITLIIIITSHLKRRKNFTD